MSDFWTVLGYVGLLVGIPASIITLIPPWRKQVWSHLRNWLYQRSNRRIDQLQEQIKGLEAAQARTQEIAEKMADSAQKTADAQTQSLQTQMDAYRQELVQADAATRDVRKRLWDLHQSSEHPNDLMTTEELRQQIIALESLVAALVEIDSKRLISAADPTPEAKRIIEAAKAHRQRNGFSELPLLPRTSSAPPTLPPPPKAVDDQTITP